MFAVVQDRWDKVQVQRVSLCERGEVAHSRQWDDRSLGMRARDLLSHFYGNLWGQLTPEDLDRPLIGMFRNLPKGRS